MNISSQRARVLSYQLSNLYKSVGVFRIQVKMLNTLRAIYYRIFLSGRFAVGSMLSVGTFEREMNWKSKPETETQKYNATENRTVGFAKQYVFLL